jgi:homeobox protein cut-like
MLNPIEKVLLALSTLVLSNRISRNLFVVYALGLHTVVLSVLYSWMTDGDSGGVSSPIRPGSAA